MMKLNKMLKMVMVLVVTLVSFSGAALTAQAAGPGGWHNDQRWEQRDNRGDRNWRNDRRPEPPKKKYTASDKKADIAIGVAVVAAVIALSK